ncbi:MAG: hypothetical protein IJF83_07450 [Methanobrevibacter sp.]|nr:hypothetical protein [Methanobrevibacter sp.]
MVLDSHERLQRKFADLYCANHLLNSIENDINQYIRGELGIETSAKIDSIHIDSVTDGDNFIILTVHVENQYDDEVFERIKEVFPGWEWELNKANLTSKDIDLRLDDDVVASIPRFLFDE